MSAKLVGIRVIPCPFRASSATTFSTIELTLSFFMHLLLFDLAEIGKEIKVDVQKVAHKAKKRVRVGMTSEPPSSTSSTSTESGE